MAEAFKSKITIIFHAAFFVGITSVFVGVSLQIQTNPKFQISEVCEEVLRPAANECGDEWAAPLKGNLRSPDIFTTECSSMSRVNSLTRTSEPVYEIALQHRANSEHAMHSEISTYDTTMPLNGATRTQVSWGFNLKSLCSLKIRVLRFK